MSTRIDIETKIEVWKNTASGMRWVTVFDRQGRETNKIVQSGRTFTLTTLERQINQDKVATPEYDTFRNGTFVLIKPSDETDMDEIKSPNSFTETEMLELVHDAMAGSKRLDKVLEQVTSLATLDRLMASLLIVDAPPELTNMVKDRISELNPQKVVRKRRVKAEAEEPDVKDEESDG